MHTTGQSRTIGRRRSSPRKRKWSTMLTSAGILVVIAKVIAPIKSNRWWINYVVNNRHGHAVSSVHWARQIRRNPSQIDIISKYAAQTAARIQRVANIRQLERAFQFHNNDKTNRKVRFLVFENIKVSATVHVSAKRKSISAGCWARGSSSNAKIVVISITKRDFLSGKICTKT